MKKTISLLTVLLLAVSATQVWADGCPTVVSATTPYACTMTVYNDSGSTLTSGTVVVWDNDDTEFDRTGYPYVTTTTTADLEWVAGVMKTGSCASGTLCEIVTYGFAWTLTAGDTDTVSEDGLVGTTTVAGMAGAYTTANDSCALGVVTELYSREGASVSSDADGQSLPVWVDKTCDD